MSVASRPVATGKTRTCPHCKAVILESLTICPGCMHHLRFDSEAAKRQVAAKDALRVEGIIRHPALEEPWEYYVVIAIRNDRGEEVTRHVVNVGALQPAEKRTFSLSVEVLPPQAPPEPETLEMLPASQPAATVASQRPAQPVSAAQAAGLKPPQPGAPPPKFGSAGRTAPPPSATVRPPLGAPAAPAPPTQKPPGTAAPSGEQTPAQKMGLRPPTPGTGPKKH